MSAISFDTDVSTTGRGVNWQALTYPLTLEIPHFVIQRKMLLGIKARAERAAGTDGAGQARHRGDVARLRASLERPGDGALERFSPDMVADLPEPARRYFLHAIPTGTPLARVARLEMTGEMRLGYDQRWLPMRARQVLAPPRGFVWEATVGMGLRRFAGADSYADGQGRTEFRLWDVVPVVRAGGPDVSRSARGRLAIEAVWCPAALLPQRGVTWTAVDDRTARASLTVDGEPIALTLIVEPDGRLRTATIERWGNLTPDEQYTWIPFGVTVLDECSADGYTVPGRVEAGWWFGTDRQLDFFRATVTRVAFLT